MMIGAMYQILDYEKDGITVIHITEGPYENTLFQFMEVIPDLENTSINFKYNIINNKQFENDKTFEELLFHILCDIIKGKYEIRTNDTE